ncbi:DUF2634 domain-containing protein [Brevibacillus fluminis]|uniref:DUF2634 domain-containing protein n=1 Tax=Brevibacillus fluminis TaxID=511487 RepID=A0A3M8DP16_9BACL|nr:DUF2634 domain-containing protein [Brevibacillus fluminis]RNB89870.1 DUF2634 domain-containing protein [Brevibacillus fluminis]
MGLEPTISFPKLTQNTRQPSRTYRLDMETGEISEQIDGKAAIEQFITKAILTIRYHFPIYSADYGCEIQSLFGRGFHERMIRSEIVRMIQEAILYDDRIERVSDFEMSAVGDEVYISFQAETVEGIISYKGVI